MNKQEQGKKIGQVITKAWNDESFKQRLLADTMAVLKEEGVDVPAGLEVRAVENTEKLVHMIIPLKPVSEEFKSAKLLLIAQNSGFHVIGCSCWQGEGIT
ncbi:NHLP leader peptide family RiPP precursor [Methanosarcina horonobensis]|uniref:NHLP leader peptide family RiPP precursor n=1 Tax=Methanosarcina horonobensis TaxID=418008 RepID=UPI0006987433|nr:NHLP leader peptide family RiPP precursor [Methanosarcina horonobensis]